MIKVVIFTIFCLLPSLSANEVSPVEVSPVIEIDEKSQEEQSEIVQPQIPDSVFIEYNEFIRSGNLYFSEKKYDLARENFEKAYNLMINFSRGVELIPYYQNSAQLNYHQGYPYRAINYYKIAASLVKSEGNEELLALIYTDLAEVFFDNFDYNSAREYLLFANDIFLNKKDYANYAKTSYNLSIIYKKITNERQSEFFLKQYSRYKSYIKKRFYMYSEDIDNIPYYVDLKANYDGKNYYEAEFALLRILNKITAKTYDFRVLIGSKLVFESLEIITHSCFQSAPEEIPEAKLLLTVNEVVEDEVQNIFYGFMLSSAPSLSALENPFYDIIISECIGKE